MGPLKSAYRDGGSTRQVDRHISRGVDVRGGTDSRRSLVPWPPATKRRTPSSSTSGPSARQLAPRTPHQGGNGEECDKPFDGRARHRCAAENARAAARRLRRVAIWTPAVGARLGADRRAAIARARVVHGSIGRPAVARRRECIVTLAYARDALSAADGPLSRPLRRPALARRAPRAAAGGTAASG